MTIEEFGKSIKSKYPQYKNMSDTELGQKVLEKYPVYKSKITGSASGKDTPLTTEQKTAKKAQIDTAITHDDQGVVVDKKPRFLTRVMDKFSNRAKEVNDIFLKRGTEMQSQTGVDRAKTAGVALAETVGRGASFVSDVGGEAMTSAFRALPDQVENPIRTAGRKVAVSKVGQAGLSALSTATEKAVEFEKQHPVAGAAARTALAALELAGAGKAASGAARTATKGTKNAALSVAETAKGAASSTKKFLAKSTDDVAEAGSKLVAKASDVVTPIEEGVETVLKTGGAATVKKGATALPKKQVMLEKFDRYTAQAKKAVSDYSQATPLELAGKEAEKALGKVQKIVKNTGVEKKALTKTLKAVKTGDIVDNARAGLRQDVTDLGVTFMKDGTLRRAPLREIKIANKADLKLLQHVDEKLATLGTNPSFQRVDDTIDYLQDLLYQRSATPLTVPVNSQLEGVIKRRIGELNSALKKIGGEKYAKLNSDYSEILEVRDVLNKGLGVDANKGASLMKQLFSPSGTMPRKLFARIKELTGIDLVEDATLAKYVMERIGDVRQASLLEQVLKGGVGGVSGRGFLQMGVNKVLNKLQDPIGKAKRIIEKRGP